MIKVIVPVEDCAEGTVSTHFGRANYYILYSIEAGKIKEIKCMENPKNFNRKPCEYFPEIGIGAVLIPSSDGIGRKAVSMLRVKSIRIFVVDAKTAEEAIRKFIEGEASEFLGEGCRGKELGTDYH